MSDNIGKRIKKYRILIGLTQQELADKIYTSRSAVGNYEIEKRIPNPIIVQLLSKEFGVSSEYLLTGKMSSYDEYIERLFNMNFQIDVSGLIRMNQILMLKFFDGINEKEKHTKNNCKWII